MFLQGLYEVVLKCSVNKLGEGESNRLNVLLCCKNFRTLIAIFNNVYAGWLLHLKIKLVEKNLIIFQNN